MVCLPAVGKFIDNAVSSFYALGHKIKQFDYAIAR